MTPEELLCLVGVCTPDEFVALGRTLVQHGVMLRLAREAADEAERAAIAAVGGSGLFCGCGCGKEIALDAIDGYAHKRRYINATHRNRAKYNRIVKPKRMQRRAAG